MKDVMIDSDGDLMLRNGDFALGEDVEQRKYLLLATDKNDWKQWPEMGVGLAGFLEDDGNAYATEIREQLVMDGMKLKRMGLNNQQEIELITDDIQ